MKKALIAVLLAIPFLISCSQTENDGATRHSLSGTDGYVDGTDAVVQSADGSLYSVGCLQSSTSAIKSKGAVAMSDCQVSLNSGTIETETTSRGKFFSNSYAYVYYPPTYYNPSYSTYNYGSSYGTPYTTYTNSNNYGSNNYNCYNDNRFKNDTFCAFVFGANSNFNCYYILGYNNSNYKSYSNYYNPSCSSQCIYSANPSVCLSRCYNQVPVYYY